MADVKDKFCRRAGAITRHFTTPHLRISDEIKNALKNGTPVVALESTLISHGFPYPENVRVAKQAEDIVRANGAVPATICIIQGVLQLGMSDADVMLFAKSKNIRKCSIRDIPLAIARRFNGSTTVAATMYIAHLAGIKVFATGGIGGVHRGGHESMDISADLLQLGKTPVAVVSAGAKAILDIPRTLEYLETQGVLVVGYKTEKMPAFYTRDSGEKVAWEAQSARECADIINANVTSGSPAGILIANPIPLDAEADAAPITHAIEQALKESVEQGVKGKELTPFLLSRVHHISEGKTTKANISLILNNAKVAAMIASELATMTDVQGTQ